ncbi:Echinoderm microtubule-associated protein-like 6 (EMAP-6) (Echinoderm microtubule-associated protein-like 5-like) [Durusdinium trenchii]|uniref:Echinoderm microtubule-associated protein-like 6 (EMAP-6) (Echinoderm microtubule-associated protein-like 5-like) n=1 Tax=Durusdinium trenchii TaxID=1381693 RepID=A0ABP0KFN2_9DINO
MASRGASSRSTSGSQRLFGKASLVGHTVRAKIGGRVTALAIPGSEASRLERISQEPVEQRRLRAHPEYGLDLEHAYGYTEGCQNLHATGRGSYCYTLSALGIVWNEESKQQSFFTGHTAEITAIAFCSSSGLIATGQKFVGSESCGIRIWSMDQKPKQKCQVLGHSQSVYSLAFSADGRWLFSIAADERGRSKGHSSSELNATTSPMCVWRLDDSRLKTGLRQARSAQVRLVVKEKVRLVPHPEDSHRLLAFGGRAAYLVTCDWAAKDAARTASWLSPSPPFDPNGLSFYNFSAGCFVPGQKDLVVLAVTSGVFVVDAAESGPVCRYGVPLENVEVRFLLPLSSGHLLCGGSGTCLSLLDSNLSKVEAIKITGVATSTLSAACLLDSDTLMAGTVDGSLCRLSLHLDAGKCHGESLQQSPSGTAEVEALAINPAALNSLAVGDSSGMVFLYDLNAKELVSSVGPFQGAVTSMAWHPRGQLLVLGLESGNLHGLLVGNSGTTPTDVEIKAALSEPTEVTAARFSPDGNWLAVGHRDGRVQVLASESTCSLTQYRQLPGNASAIMGLQFTKDRTVEFA